MRAVVLPGIPLELAKKRWQPHPPLQWQHSYSKDVERADLPSRDDTFVGARSSSIECTLKFDTPSTRVDAEVCVCTWSQLLPSTSRTSIDTASFALVDLPCRSIPLRPGSGASNLEGRKELALPRTLAESA